MQKIRSSVDAVRETPPQLMRRETLRAPVGWEELPLVLSVDEAAKVVGVGSRAIYAMVRITGFPVVHFGRVIRIPRDAFRRWLDSRVR